MSVIRVIVHTLLIIVSLAAMRVFFNAASSETGDPGASLLFMIGAIAAIILAIACASVALTTVRGWLQQLGLLD